MRACLLCLCLLSGLTVASAAPAQDNCGMGGCAGPADGDLPTVTASESRLTTREVFLMANEILAISGLANNLKIHETMDVYNAAAYIEDQERVIGFNPLWVLKFKDMPVDDRWPLYAVIAHEIGHHLLGHTILPGGSRPATELEADAFAGFTLHALGATLPQAQTLWQGFSESGSDTHPPRQERLAAVEQGWLQSAGRAGLAIPDGTPDGGSGPGDPDAVRQRPDENAGDVSAQAGSDGTEDSQTSRGARPDLPAQSICAPLPKGGARGRLCATTALDALSVSRLLDGDIRSSWSEQAPGNGRGSRLLFDFETPISAARLTIVNGDNSDEKTFRRYARLESITLSGSNGFKRTIAVRDHRGEQSWTLAGFEGVDWIEVHVDSVIDGRRYDTLAVSTLRFD
ncbi:NADase-type glycan-binding domain-containing protein [Jannaschia pohangensis]|uniref:Nicotine adenine dinucleotide glycohydrolase (NADase) n=1 Tax=Jannaschia pohangensis TaxID=390807 RepID=A0A1I3S1D9_9RHOB|nr:hypothetical protein [Jannaschia pohangensis]SFJ52683.1 Nicotine adenine dinucleotide glycohydrolase (NADase) [Jannaschia pohangensis]